MLLYFLVTLIFASAFAVIVLLHRSFTAGRLRVMLRLERIRQLGQSEDDDVLSRPFFERVMRPAWHRFVAFVNGLTPSQVRSSLERRLTLAGNPMGLRTQSFMAVTIGLLVGLPLVFTPLAALVGAPVSRAVGTGFLMGLIGVIFLNLIVTRSIRERQEAVLRSLPDVLDLLLVSVEAGLAFDAAMGRVAERMPGVLPREMQRALHEMQLGKQRRQALRDLSDRLQVKELAQFVTAIVQADQLGTSIGQVLRVQAENIRRAYRQRAEELAMKAPIKMLFPLIFFIFPALFVVLLGPGVLHALRTLLPLTQ